MNTQAPWSGSGTTNPSNPAAGTSVDVRNPNNPQELANSLLIRNTGGTHALEVSWDGGSTFTTTVPSNTYIQLWGIAIDFINVKADAGTTTYEWIGTSAH